ncbi:MAG: hypothetical protein LBL55_03810 [Propionibacteriaceae bacterium]|jgi:hypothetical protein|nr:hypothetical protein [Propionibacteriaceae bacterium]
MRTTVDLPPRLHQRARDHAARQHQSLSSALAELVALGLEAAEPAPDLDRDAVSGFPVVRLGRPLTAAEVAELLGEDER